jgi:pimeloyl-ACP methyl ester carboxylesterase
VSGGPAINSVCVGSGPPVVLVHGLGVSGDSMNPLANILRYSFTTFVVDLPGHGRSLRPRAPLGIEGMARLLGDWLQAAGAIRPIVVANSMGCQWATELSVLRPGLLGPLVLVGPTVDPARRRRRHQLVDALRASCVEPPSLLAGVVRNTASAAPRLLHSDVRAALADRIEERLPLIAQPAVVVYGDRDAFIGPEWAAQAAMLLPSGRLVVARGATHAVQYVQPSLVAGIVGELSRDHAPCARRPSRPQE